jgi:hypothetical protein
VCPQLKNIGPTNGIWPGCFAQGVSRLPQLDIQAIANAERALTRLRLQLDNEAIGARLGGQLEPPSAATANDAPPQWNAERRELSFRSKIVKTYRQPAKNQEAILDAFQVENWPARIDDPLPFTKDGDARQRLADAVLALNKNGAILFELDGKQRVIWKPL